MTIHAKNSNLTAALEKDGDTLVSESINVLLTERGGFRIVDMDNDDIKVAPLATDRYYNSFEGDAEWLGMTATSTIGDAAKAIDSLIESLSSDLCEESDFEAHGYR